MSRAKICVQLYTLRREMARLGVYETLKKLHELGFTSVEVSALEMTEANVSQLKKASEDFGMEIAALSAGENELKDLDKIVSDCKALGSRYVRVGMIPFRIMGYKDKAMEFIRDLEDAAERLEKEGIKFYYHNHHYEFQKYDGAYLLDIMRESTEKLGFELDVHWIQRGGEDPIRIIKRFVGRVDLLHLKDYRIGPVSFTDEELKEQKVWDKLANIVQYAELGEGNLDLQGIVETGLECGAKYLIIEQDETYDKDPFESLKISKEALEKLGYGDLL